MPSLPRRGPGRPRKVPAVQQRAQVLRAAREVFAGSGLRAATIEEVAHRAGVTRQAVYEQFGDKRALFHAVIVALMDELDAVMRPPGDDDLDDADWVRACFAQALGYLSEHPETELLAREAIHSGDPVLGQIRVPLTARYANELRRRFARRGVPLGGLADTVVTMALGMTEAVTSMPRGSKRPDLDALVEMLTQFTMGGLAALLGEAESASVAEGVRAEEAL